VSVHIVFALFYCAFRIMENEEFPKDLLPWITWSYFFYEQQQDFIKSEAWQTWYIGGNGTGKTLVVYWTDVGHMLGVHPKQLAPPPIKIKCLVPSFDNVEDVALSKLLENQRLIFPLPMTAVQAEWTEFLKQNGSLIDFCADKGDGTGFMEIGPLLPESMMVPKKGFTKEHRGIELANGSSIWFSTSEQGWQAQRGFESDILSIDEEGDERVTDECVRGLRNAKGGGRIYAGLTPPYMPGQGPTWTKERVLEASLDDVHINCVNACMADNPAITKFFIKQFSKGKTQKQIDVQVFGKYPTWGDLVYDDYQDRLWDEEAVEGNLLPNSTSIPDAYDVDWVMAFDWHISKATAAVWGWVDHDGNVVFFDEIDKEWAESKEIHELANGFFQIEGHPHMKRKFRRWQDPSARVEYKAIKKDWNAWDAFRRVGVITAAAKNRNPEIGIDIVNRYMRGNTKDHPRVFFFEKLKYTRQYMKNHYWKRGKEDPKGKPDPKWSDYPICVRYILQELGWKHDRKRKKVWPKYSFGQLKAEKQIYQVNI